LRKDFHPAGLVLDLPGAGARLGPAAPHLSVSLWEDGRAMPEYSSSAAVVDQYGGEPRLLLATRLFRTTRRWTQAAPINRAWHTNDSQIIAAKTATKAP
jgi:hypothetical protein